MKALNIQQLTVFALIAWLAASPPSTGEEQAKPALDAVARREIIAAASRAVHKHMTSTPETCKGDEIAKELWGEAITRLKPLRVLNDRANVFIVLKEDETSEEGLYMSNPISSYAPVDKNRFMRLEQLSQPGDKAFDQLYYCKIRKAQPTSRAPDRGDESFVAHEWGTFTTIAGEDGVAIEWKPFAGEDDLPDFVYDLIDLSNWAGVRRRPAIKEDMVARVRMETPVIYFYAKNEMEVTVKVDFPEGKITEWYPRARTVHAGIDWGRVRLLPGVTTNYPVENAPSHYYRARETDAAAIRVCSFAGNQYEKFLFYRGVGSFAVPLRATLDGERIRVVGDVGRVIVFENQGGRVGWTIGERECARPSLDRHVDELLPEFERLLVGHGLYQKEARAMIATWRDSWFEEGLRVFYVLPRATTDRVLPLHIEPAPRELVRVMVGRMELITPEVNRAFVENRSDAVKRFGRFAEPILQQLAAAARQP